MYAGTDGRQITLRTNVFPVRLPQQYCLYQYHVDFNPPVPNPGARKSMIADSKEMFGNIYMFDGMVLFLQIRLENEVRLLPVADRDLNFVKRVCVMVCLQSGR